MIRLKLKEEAFVYRWTNVTNNKVYIGFHAGSQNDGYIASGAKFNRNVYDPNIFIREILGSGTCEEMRKLEDLHLKALDRDQCYNKQFKSSQRASKVVDRYYLEGTLKSVTTSEENSSWLVIDIEGYKLNCNYRNKEIEKERLESLVGKVVTLTEAVTKNSAGETYSTFHTESLGKKHDRD